MTWPSLQNIPLEAMHCGKTTVSSLILTNQEYKVASNSILLCSVFVIYPVADTEGAWGCRPSKIGQNLAKLAPFLPIFVSMPP